VTGLCVVLVEHLVSRLERQPSAYSYGNGIRLANASEDSHVEAFAIEDHTAAAVPIPP
jgi:hypothetical protein